LKGADVLAPAVVLTVTLMVMSFTPLLRALPVTSIVFALWLLNDALFEPAVNCQL
jgi:hypothetical protein